MCAGMGWWCMVWHPCSYVTPTSGWEREKKRNEMKGRKKSWTAMWLNLQILYWQQRRENRRDSKQASLAAAGMDGSHLLWWSFSDLSRGLEGELHYCPPTELRLSFWDGWRKHKGRIAWLNDLCPSKLLKPERTSSGTNNRGSWKLHKWARADVMRHSLPMSHLAFFLCVWQNKKMNKIRGKKFVLKLNEFYNIHVF